ncbi:hypothetical protein [Desulfogranum japonicum]|uniref:hypothetical protein n=1 Tax=Desulfogranum japonicum TaxID=231447 RepID=UPI00048AB2A6|nr:hypothetical protein [Desulfogranum japonicum]
MKTVAPGKALVFATTGTIFNVLHKKIGGHASGGRYSDPHTWTEMRDLAPQFIGLFIIIFLAVYFYDSLSSRKTLICPQCERPFDSYKKNIDSKCSACGIEGVPIKKYYK